MKYRAESYRTGFAMSGDEWIEMRPGWFARVILRRKPKRVYMQDVARQLRAAAARELDRVAREIFEAGK